MTKAQQAAVRNYLTSLRNPSALRDDDAIADLHTKLDQTDDGIERLKLRQRLLDPQDPPLEPYEAAFVEHAKAWADTTGVTGDAFVAEGVPTAVLRRAGFRGVVDGGTQRARRSTADDWAASGQRRRGPRRHPHRHLHCQRRPTGDRRVGRGCTPRHQRTGRRGQRHRPRPRP